MDLKLKTLSQTMTVEAIAAIKAKRLAMKQDITVRRNQKRMELLDQDLQEQKHQNEILKKVAERERQHRTYDEQWSGEKDLSGVLAIVSKVFNSSKGCGTKKKVPSPKAEEEPIALPEQKTIKPNPKTKYNRYGQEKFLKDQQLFGINPQGTNLEKTKTGHLSPKRCKLDKTKTVKRVYLPRQMASHHSRMPIIVVPAALSSLITIHNARQLLQEMRYVTLEQARQSLSGEKRLDEIIIERVFQGRTVSYRVIDNVSRLSPQEWERVSAVFALGPHWQFKGWPQGGDPALICLRVCAFHLHFKDMVPCKDLLGWQVHMLDLPRSERHSDCAVLSGFWNTLDQHMAVRPRQFAFMKGE
ncbi:parafibromin [Drosophila ficusphila]|uniref:parafibromin n=1 Tax=Drosophila ficusphila TaxID=30025 RepID=UPI0007E67FCC|nr:parafibromin [Drosophila ficusphila]